MYSGVYSPIEEICEVTEPQKSLRAAVLSKNLFEIKSLISLEVDINARYENGWTVLHLSVDSIDKDSYQVIKELLISGADVNAQDVRGNTPIHFLLKNTTVRRVETIELFLKFGADVNIKDCYGETPLPYAIGKSNAKIVKLLLDHGSDVNNFIATKLRPLHYACSWSTEAIVKLLIEYGADVNALDSCGCTPLMRALANSRASEDLISFLLNYSDVNAINVLTATSNVNFLMILLRHFAKLLALGLWINPSVLKTISNREDYSVYFFNCLEELELAKKTKVEQCWVTFFNLLVDNKRKLKNYCGNKDLVEGFYKSDCENKFPIYNASIRQNVERGIVRRNNFDEAAEALSDNWPIFSRNHLIVRDVLDCLSHLDTKILLSRS